ncbi:MAG TPA: acyl-CoA dehydrogenase, partial [Rhodobacteraceae bacterium]|nr:acyl-CoA dehydrogenase [Paracoccaceae bacterium]
MTQDAPIFDPATWGLTEQQAELSSLARKLGQEKFAPRAAKYDREASFPTENYKDFFDSGMMGIAIPKEYGGHGADFKTYMLTAAEIGRYCGSTALTFNMHVCSCLWSGFLLDTFDMPDAMRAEHNKTREHHYRRILDDGAIYAQPFSEGGAAAAGS